MNIEVIKQLYEKGLFSVHDSFDTWQQALIASAQPLLDKGYIEPEYCQSLVDTVDEFGPYIWIAPHVCMPHSKQVALVKEAAISFMKVNNPVSYNNDPDLSAELFFVLAVKDHESHLDYLGKLVDVLDDEDTLNALLEARDEADFKRLFK